MAKENYSQLLKEFENRQTVLKSMPACFYIESVRGCLGKCAMCGMHHTPPRLISEDLLNKIEPYFNRLEVLGIHGGGEPLLGNIPYFVEQSVKHNFAIHMNTTGVFLSKEMADLLLKTRLSIIFSVHAGKPDTYKKIMGYDFKKVLGNINYLAQKDKEKKKGSVLGFSFIVMKENIDEIEDFLKIARDAGMGSVRFMRLRPNKHILQGVKMPERQLEFNYHEQYNAGIKREFLKRLPIYKELAGKLGIRITHGSMEFTARYSPFTLTGRREPCKAPGWDNYK
jgi:MoaA/NifB/PqqE/SkfB family radical SAM enzyme